MEIPPLDSPDAPDDSEFSKEDALALGAVMPQLVATDVLAAHGLDWSAANRSVKCFEELGLSDSHDVPLVEQMLLDQALVLQNLFGHYAKSAYRNRANPPHFQAYADVALKAQNQCRRTLATLVDIRNPRRTQFIKKQVNQAVNQQVNNTLVAPETRKIQNQGSSELLTVIPNETVDGRATPAPIENDARLAALETQHRP